MKIGEFSRAAGVSIPTVRYYIQKGLLIPERDVAQYEFSELDAEVMRRILRFKRWGFSLEEIHKLLSIQRFSTGPEPEDKNDYLVMLMRRKEKLQTRCGELREYIDEIGREIQWEQDKGHRRKVTGVPIQALKLLCCPHCRSELQISQADMDSRHIFQGGLRCQCGYKAEIRNGIIYSGQLQDTEDIDKADMDRSLYRSCPSELVSLIQKSYNWVTWKVRDCLIPGGKVVMETHMNSFFYLYKHLGQLNSMSPGNLYIVQDKFSEIVELYKGYLDQSDVDLDILYIVSPDTKRFPIKACCVDLLIDYNSTNEFGIFSHKYYLKEMREYLKPSSRVVGTYFYFDPGSMSLKNLNASYPGNAPENYTLDYFGKNTFGTYRVLTQELAGISQDSGTGITFIFHKTGEKLYLLNYVLKVQA